MERHGQAYSIMYNATTRGSTLLFRGARNRAPNWLQSLMGETRLLSIICLLHEAVTGADPGFQKSGGGGVVK